MKKLNAYVKCLYPADLIDWSSNAAVIRHWTFVYRLSCKSRSTVLNVQGLLRISVTARLFTNTC